MSRPNGPALSQSDLSDDELLALPTPELLAAARLRRDEAHGTRVTYSPKVFLPLTKLCNDRCGYCTFAQPPARMTSPYMSLEEVLEVARAGAEAGCHEALFTLGERPELRYPVAREWLDAHGYASTLDYLAAAARAVLAETGLLPHLNGGALHADELEALRPVAPSQGMMVETLDPTLPAHVGSPDKTPERRLATLEAAGDLAIPFTTGILVGIGESREDRLASLRAIAAAHRRHGHIQEVLVQNFLPKAGTSMHRSDPCPPGDFHEAIAWARLLLPPEVHIQAPPNLTDDASDLLAAGVDDFGGISPITVDHVNPERPWPQVEHLAGVCASAGHQLTPRLTVHPRWAADRDRWLDPALHFAVMDRADAEWLARDDPGAVFPSRVRLRAPGTVADGAEVEQVGLTSTAWYAGSTTPPPPLLPPSPISPPPAGARGHRRSRWGPIGGILGAVLAGERPGEAEIVTLFSARGAEVLDVCDAADELRRSLVGDEVTYVVNRNINYTNVCTFKCKFCGFSKGPLSLNLRGSPYLLTLDDIASRAREAGEAGATEVTLQGGIHPSFDGDYYIEVCRAIHDAAPDIHLHGFTALEVTEGARRLGEDLETYLRRLRDAGLRSLPGTAAEILDDEVRRDLCADKVTTDEWLECHRVAHRVGLRSNVTIMFGTIEHPLSWARHLLATRDLQEETGGFTEFVPLPFVHMAAPIYLHKGSRRGPTFREVLLMHAVGRLAYGDLIPNIQASWVKLGMEGVSQCLRAGVNDLGGTLMNESISRAAGASHGQGVTADDFRSLAESLGRPVRQRSTLYDTVPGACAPLGAH